MSPAKSLWRFGFFEPDAVSVMQCLGRRQYDFELWKIHPAGVFEVVLPESNPANRDQRLNPPRALTASVDLSPMATASRSIDAYAFPPVLTDYDLYLFGEGTHYLKYEKLGAHVREDRRCPGRPLCVWAPNAKRVSVVGDFNFWDGRVDAMRGRATSGIWEIFVPALKEGEVYKFEILSRVGNQSDSNPILTVFPASFGPKMRPSSAASMATSGGQNLDRRPNHTRLASFAAFHLRTSRRLVAAQYREGNRWLTYRELATN